MAGAPIPIHVITVHYYCVSAPCVQHMRQVGATNVCTTVTTEFHCQIPMTAWLRPKCCLCGQDQVEFHSQEIKYHVKMGTRRLFMPGTVDD